MVDPGELASTIILLFFGIGILGAVYAALYGGDVQSVTSLISALAGPIIFIAVLVFFAATIFNTVAGR